MKSHILSQMSDWTVAPKNYLPETLSNEIEIFRDYIARKDKEFEKLPPITKGNKLNLNRKEMEEQSRKGNLKNYVGKCIQKVFSG